MVRLNVELTDDLERIVGDRVRQTNHATPTDYVRDLIRQDAERAKLEAMLLDGLDSGEPIEVTPDYLNDLDRRMQAAIDRHAD